MSAFDDEFGLFGEDEAGAEEERRSTLGARKIAADEAAHDDIEPEDERPRRGPRGDRRERTADLAEHGEHTERPAPCRLPRRRQTARRRSRSRSSRRARANRV